MLLLVEVGAAIENGGESNEFPLEFILVLSIASLPFLPPLHVVSLYELLIDNLIDYFREAKVVHIVREGDVKT